jgi:hypothetical protein
MKVVVALQETCPGSWTYSAFTICAFTICVIEVMASQLSRRLGGPPTGHCGAFNKCEDGIKCCRYFAGNLAHLLDIISHLQYVR